MKLEEGKYTQIKGEEEEEDVQSDYLSPTVAALIFSWQILIVLRKRGSG